MNKNQIKKDCFEYFRNTDWALIAFGKIVFFENRKNWFEKIMVKNFPTLKYSSVSCKAIFGTEISVTISE